MNNCDQDWKNRDKPKWDEHDYPAICMCGNANWFGLVKPNKPTYSEEWKGKELTLPRGDGQFLKYGSSDGVEDIESMFEVRPTNA